MKSELATRNGDPYVDWWLNWAGKISDQIMYPLLDGADMLWNKRMGKPNYDKRLHACYAETAMLASQVLGEE